MEEKFNDLRVCKYPGCNIPIRRPNQLFCSLSHKNAFHYGEVKEINKIYFIPDKKLHKNNEVLKMYFELSLGKTFIDLRPLVLAGLDIYYFTRIMHNRETGEKLYILYDYGFIINESKQIKIYNKNGGF